MAYIAAQVAVTYGLCSGWSVKVFGADGANILARASLLAMAVAVISPFVPALGGNSKADTKAPAPQAGGDKKKKKAGKAE